MKLQDQVCTLEQAKKLKELGICQLSVCCYIDGALHLFEKRFYDWAEQKNLNACAAFTVAELGVMLPSETYTWRGSENSKIANWEWVDDGNGKAWCGFTNEAEARADLLLHLLEAKLTTAAEVNARLQL